MTHDERCARATDAVSRVSKGEVASAFIASLGTRDRVGRSALGSLAILQHLAAHSFSASLEFIGRCRVCGENEEERPDGWERGAQRRQAYPFQVRHTDIEYASYDLTAFAGEAPRTPSRADVALLHGLVASVRALPPGAGLTELSRCLIGSLKSNRFERQILLEQWGYCGILCPADQESYRDHFVPFETRERRQPDHYFRREWEYPVRFWRAADGIDAAALESWFGPWL